MDNKCSYCSGSMRISKLTCEDCALALEGDFYTPRLYRLSREEQSFIEMFVLASGSLKEMAEKLNLSYPTIRNRLDALIDAIKQEGIKDQQRKEQILDDIENGKISAKQGMRMINAL